MWRGREMPIRCAPWRPQRNALKTPMIANDFWSFLRVPGRTMGPPAINRRQLKKRQNGHSVQKFLALSGLCKRIFFYGWNHGNVDVHDSRAHLCVPSVQKCKVNGFAFRIFLSRKERTSSFECRHKLAVAFDLPKMLASEWPMKEATCTATSRPTIVHSCILSNLLCK